MVDFGEKLKTLRNGKGLTQNQLATKLMITKSMISAYENSVRLPSYDVLIKICAFFNISSDYFFGFMKNQYLDITGLTQEQVAILSRLIDEFKLNRVTKI